MGNGVSDCQVKNRPDHCFFAEFFRSGEKSVFFVNVLMFIFLTHFSSGRRPGSDPLVLLYSMLSFPIGLEMNQRETVSWWQYWERRSDLSPNESRVYHTVWWVLLFLIVSSSTTMKLTTKTDFDDVMTKRWRSFVMDIFVTTSSQLSSSTTTKLTTKMGNDDVITKWWRCGDEDSLVTKFRCQLRHDETSSPLCHHIVMFCLRRQLRCGKWRHHKIWPNSLDDLSLF